MGFKFYLLKQLLKRLPLESIEKAIKSTLQTGANKMNLLTKNDLDAQNTALQEINTRLDKIEQQLNQLTKSQDI